jgi:hypothetical protein
MNVMTHRRQLLIIACTATKRADVRLLPASIATAGLRFVSCAAGLAIILAQPHDSMSLCSPPSSA